MVAEMIHEPMTRGHADRLVPMIGEVLVLADNPHIEKIVVSIGPGSFTGLRVGIAAARALGLAWDTPVVGVSTMTALAAAAQACDATPVLVVHDAKRSHVYAQLFDSAGLAMSEITVEMPETAAAIAYAHAVAVVGTGATLLPSIRQLDISPFPLPFFMVDRAERHPLGLVPLYVRPPDAQPLSVFA